MNRGMLLSQTVDPTVRWIEAQTRSAGILAERQNEPNGVKLNDCHALIGDRSALDFAERVIGAALGRRPVSRIRATQSERAQPRAGRKADWRARRRSRDPRPPRSPHLCHAAALPAHGRAWAGNAA